MTWSFRGRVCSGDDGFGLGDMFCTASGNDWSICERCDEWNMRGWSKPIYWLVNVGHQEYYGDKRTLWLWTG